MRFITVITSRRSPTLMDLLQMVARGAFILCAIFIVCGIPVSSWRGYPKGFSRFNWFGIAFLTGAMGPALIWFANITERGDLEIAVVTGSVGILMLAFTLGSLGAIFFCRTGEGRK